MKCSAAFDCVLAAAALMSLVGSAGGQPAYPNKPIRFIVPYPPGGATTPLARLVGQKLTESWGQAVIVDNRGGGNTIIGSEAMAKSPPDGYTILLVSNTHVINPLLYPNLPYDAVKDFAPIATLTGTELILAVNPLVPANNLREFIALAKSKPGQLNYASSGSGGAIHLAAELLNIMAGIKMNHVPYKGGGAIMTDLIGGQVQLAFNLPINLVPHIKSGRLKAIAITGETRLAALPQVPTFTEAGVSGFEVKAWYGVLAPAGTPKGIIDKLSAEIAKILAMPDSRETLVARGMGPIISSPEQFAALMKAETAKYARIIKAANIKLEN